MSSISYKLTVTLDHIESGSFEKALEIADSVIRNSKDSFWGWYLGAVALALLKDDSSFNYYLQNTEKILPDSTYLKLLKAYSYLKHDQEDKALLEWTNLIDRPQGWFAKDLLEDFRISSRLKEKAKKGDVTKFIILPDLRKEIAQYEKDLLKKKKKKKIEKDKKKSEQEEDLLEESTKKRSGTLLLRTKKVAKIFFFSVFVLGTIFFISLGSIHIIKNYDLSSIYNFFTFKNDDEKWKYLDISSTVSIISDLSVQNFLYKYKKKQNIINDFEKAKKLLSKKKVNQSRYLLQRIIQSNADFKTKEKCKIFLKFIPDLHFEDFNDPILLNDLLKESNFYLGSQILQKGQVFALRDVKNGKQLQILVEEGEEDYIIDAFINFKDPSSNWKSYDEFEKNRKNLRTKIRKAVIFGKFKGLLGQQKRIYVELSHLWL